MILSIASQHRQLILRLGNTDALPVAARFMASVLICRIVVAFELRGMRAVAQVVEEVGELGQSLTPTTSNSVQTLNNGVTKRKPNYSEDC